MDKAAIAFTASKASMKNLVDDYYKDQDLLIEARDPIAKGSEDLKEFQDALAAKNRVPGVNGLKILDINADGRIISVTQYTLD